MESDVVDVVDEVPVLVRTLDSTWLNKVCIQSKGWQNLILSLLEFNNFTWQRFLKVLRCISL